MRNGSGGTRALLGAIALSAAVAAACGGGPKLTGATAPVTSLAVSSDASTTGTPPTTMAPPSTTLPLTPLGARYEQIVAPANVATNKVDGDVESSGNLTVSTSQFSVDVAAASKAFTVMDQELLSLPAPPRTVSDIRSLVAANQVVIGELSQLASDMAAGDMTAATALRVRIGQDSRSRTTAVATVRQDLGLPSTR